MKISKYDMNVQDGYKKITNVLALEDTKNLEEYLFFLQKYSSFYGNAGGVMNSLNKYADIVGESLLIDLHPLVEGVTGRKLMPTYSFLRVYNHGASLKMHKDRPSCEVSCSLTLSYSDDGEKWPLYVESNGEEIPIYLNKGEALIYYGRDLKHWRKTFNGKFSMHVFLHYIDVQGPYTSFKYDKRSQISGRPDFRDSLKSRLYTLRNIGSLDQSSLIIRTFYIPYKIQKNRSEFIVVFDNKFELRVLPFMEKYVMNLLSKNEVFRLSEVKDQIFEVEAINIIKTLLVAGHFDLSE